MVITWSLKAKQHLKDIYTYIAADSPFYAAKVKEEILGTVNQLADFPASGRIVPEIHDPTIRECLLYSYRLIYQTFADQIYILAIVHMRQWLYDKKLREN